MTEFDWGPREDINAELYLTPDGETCCLQLPEKEETAIRSDRFVYLKDMV